MTGSARGPHAVTSMGDVVLVSIEPANSILSGTKVMARALEALDRANVEIWQSPAPATGRPFVFWSGQTELGSVMEHLEESLSLELAHGYLKPFDVDKNVGLIAVVGEGDERDSGIGGANLHGHIAEGCEYYRDRTGIERIDDCDCGPARRAGKRRKGDSSGVRAGAVEGRI